MVMPCTKTYPTVDMHVHFGAPSGPDGNIEACYWSKKFKDQAAYVAMLAVTGFLLRINKVSFLAIKENFFTLIRSARRIDQVVLLALDAVYDESGRRSLGPGGMTHLYVSNRCLLELQQEYYQRFGKKRILFGASVHPYRPDWEQELDWCLEQGAVLCKWIPSVMMIDPHHDHCIPFYRKLARHRLPLLVHLGHEHAIPVAKPRFRKFNNPIYLRKALDEGVTVIAAHAAMPVFAWDDDRDFYELIDLFSEAKSKPGWNLYADLSALCLPHRNRYVKMVIAEGWIPPERILYGSDYPIFATDFIHRERSVSRKRTSQFLRTLTIRNFLDKNLALVEQMGFPRFDEILNNTSRLFSVIVRNPAIVIHGEK